MSRVPAFAILVTVCLSASVLAGPKFLSTWKSPDAARVSFAGKKVASLVISDDQNLRVSAEEALLRELAAIGLPQGVASYKIVPREELRDPARARGWYDRSNVDGVVAMRLVDARTRKTWEPSLWMSPTYSTFSGYYGYGWNNVYVYDPGRTRTDVVVSIETLVFSVPQDKLLWAGVTESINPKDASRVIKDVVEATVKEMRKQGLARKTSDRN